MRHRSVHIKMNNFVGHLNVGIINIFIYSMKQFSYLWHASGNLSVVR